MEHGPRVKIVPFTGEHLDGCACLFATTFSAEPWNEPWSPATARTRIEELAGTPGFVGSVALYEEKPVGLVLGCYQRQATGWLFYLQEMCVDVRRQGGGIGRMLLHHLEEELRSTGVDRVFLLTSRNNLAETFYIRNEYRRDQTVAAMSKLL